MKAHKQLLSKLEQMEGAWADDDENDRKMSEIISAIMDHMCALIEQSESFRGRQRSKTRV